MSRTNRRSEYELFAKVTHKLRVAAAKGKPGFAALADAVHHNRQMWTLLASDVADKTRRMLRFNDPKGVYSHCFCEID